MSEDDDDERKKLTIEHLGAELSGVGVTRADPEVYKVLPEPLGASMPEVAKGVEKMLIAWGKYNVAKCGWAHNQRKGADGSVHPWMAKEIVACQDPEEDEFEDAF